jgi:hypothetical protein
MESKKVVFTLTGEAVAILESAATERKRGPLISQLLVEWKENQIPDNELGILENIAAGVRRIEKRSGLSGKRDYLV